MCECSPALLFNLNRGRRFFFSGELPEPSYAASPSESLPAPLSLLNPKAAPGSGARAVSAWASMSRDPLSGDGRWRLRAAGCSLKEMEGGIESRPKKKGCGMQRL